MKKLLLSLLMLPIILLGQDYYSKGDAFVQRTKQGEIASSYNISTTVSINGDFVVVKSYDPSKYMKVSVTKRSDTYDRIVMQINDRDIKTIEIRFAIKCIVFYPVNPDDNLIFFFYDSISKTLN